MKTTWGVAGAAALALSLSGCAPAIDHSVIVESPAATPSPSAKTQTYYGETASAIASDVTGCGSLQAGDVGKGGPGLASTASCSLGGRTVDFYSWSDAKALAGVADLVRANKTEVYYAAGTGWTAHVRRDKTFQWQLTNDAGNLLKYASENHPVPAADLLGEKATAQKIADALGGYVQHLP